MIGITNNTQIWLCQAPLTKDNINQLTFNNATEQANYFKSISVKTFTEFTYQRQPVGELVKNYIAVNSNIDSLYNCNYVMYRNSEFTEKYFFAFIDRLEYKSEQVTYIHISSDSFQNWQFNIEYKPSFIERQTPAEDYINTLSDNPSQGQLEEKISLEYRCTGFYMAFCTCTVAEEGTQTGENYCLKVGGLTIPCWCLVWRVGQQQQMADTLQQIAKMGWGDRVLAVVYIPYITDFSLIEITDVQSQYTGTLHVATNIPINAIKETIQFDLSQFSNAAYKKELTYPYSKILVQDMISGQGIELNPCMFKNNIAEFLVTCDISEKPYIRVTPLDYAGQDKAYSDSLVINVNASLPLANNLYAKYMMENKESNFYRQLFATVGMGISGASGNPLGIVGGVLNYFNTVASIVSNESQAKKLSNQVSSIKDGLCERINNENFIKISYWSMDSNHLDVARNYWKNFGYPVRKKEIPLIKGNSSFNYVKLVAPNIIGKNVPQDELNTIKDIFQNGVTLYHSPNEFLGG